MSDPLLVIFGTAVIGGLAVIAVLAIHHATRPPMPRVTATITMPKIGDPLTFTGGVIENVSAHPAVTNGLLMLITQEMRAIRATLEVITGTQIRPVPESAGTEPVAGDAHPKNEGRSS